MSNSITVQTKATIVSFSDEGVKEFNSVVDDVLDVLKDKPLHFDVAIAVLQEAERRVLELKINWN